MQEKAGTVRLIALFLLVAFSLAAPFWYLLASAHPPEVQHRLVVAQMWCPGAAALLLALCKDRGIAGLGFKLPGWRYAVSGFLIPIAYSLAAYGAIWASGAGGFPDRDFLHSLTERFAGCSAPLSVSLYLLEISTVSMANSAFAALGEEIGWRGYLVPRLRQIANPFRVGLVSGIIWALWHYPAILFDGYHNGAPLWFSIICFTVMVIALSLIMVWFRLRSNSIWPCVLLHASHNNFIEFLFAPLTTAKPVTSYFADEFGIGLAVTVSIAALLLWRRRPET